MTSDRTERLEQLFRLGQQKELWTQIKECAEAIGADYNQFRRALKGDRASEGIEAEITRIEQYLTGKSIELPGPPEEKTFAQLYRIGVDAELWTNYTECAEKIGLTAATISKYVKAKPASNASERAKSMYMRACNLMNAKVGKIASKKTPKEEQKRVEPPKPKPRPLSEVSTDAPPPPEPPHHPGEVPQGASPLMEWVAGGINLLATLIADKVSNKVPTQAALPSGINPSDWLNELVAGRLEIQGQKVGDVRFVLRAPPFFRLFNSFTGKELQDTEALGEALVIGLAEYRRRLSLSAQATDDSVRAKEVKDLGQTNRAILAALIATARTLVQFRECDLNETALEYATKWLEFEHTNISAPKDQK